MMFFFLSYIYVCIVSLAMDVIPPPVGACGLGLALFQHVYLRSRGDSELGVNQSVTLSSVTYPQCSTHNVRVKWWRILNNANSHLHIISLNFLAGCFV